MILDEKQAQKVSKILLNINAVKLSVDDYFTWASGWKSPIYCDNRVLLSYPEYRDVIAQTMTKQIEQHYGKPDAIAAVATGAIGVGMLVADIMKLPMVYVRPEKKKHGRKNQIEGHIEKHKTVIVVEDLISTGMSSLQAVVALQEQKIVVKGMAAIFTYQFEKSKEAFQEQKVPIFTLSNYSILVDQAMQSNYIDQKDIEMLKKWRIAPHLWKA